MKISPALVCILILLAGCARHHRSGRGAATTPVEVGSATASGGVASPPTNVGPYTIVARGPHHRVWASVTWNTNHAGRAVARTNSYTELASGLARLKQGSWVETTTDIYPADGGAAATNTAHLVFFAVNPNVSEALRLTTPDGKVLSSHVLCLSYFDVSTGSNAVIAELHDSLGQITDSNKVLYPGALQGSCTADIQYENKRAGLEQNIILKTGPPSPADYGMNPSATLLQVWSEFVNPPTPRVAATTNSEAGIVDQFLDFGAMKMGPGRGFFAGQPGKSPAHVFKEWVNAENRTFLVEQIPLLKVVAEMQSLPGYSPGTGTNSAPPANGNPPPPTNSPPGAFLHRLNPLQSLPPPRMAQHNARQMQLAAMNDAPASGYVIDYSILSSRTNFTFQADTTYLVSDGVGLSGQTVIEGGTVVKFAPAGAGTIYVGNGPADSLDCQTSAYRPAIFTAKDDNTVGESISSTGSPTNFYASMVMDIYGPTNELKYLCVKYAGVGVVFDTGPDHSTFRIKHSQFSYCDLPIIGYSANATLELQNLLIWHCSEAVEDDWGSLQVNAQHLTVDSCGSLANQWSSAATLNLTNSLLVAVTNWGNITTITTNAVAIIADPSSVFQTVGAGSHYLAAESPYRGAGTTNIPSLLLTELRTKTTYPPIVIPKGGFPSSILTLSPQAQRNGTNVPIGYSYDPLDYQLGAVVMTNTASTVTIQPGTAISVVSPGFYGYGLVLENGSTLSVQGAADNPVIVAQYNLVQESNPAGWVPPWSAMFGDIGIGADSTISFRFANFFSAAHDCNFVPQFSNLPINFQDCQLHGGMLSPYNASVNFTNCVLQRVSCDFESWVSDTFELRNNLFSGGSCSLYPAANNTVEIKDNLFDQTVISSDVTGWDSDFNAYVTNYSRLSPTNTHDIILTNTDYRAGPLGAYYYGPGMLPHLANAGSVTNAGFVGLYHYTTTTNLVGGLEIAETNSVLDVGFHFVATDANGKPIDTDGDGLANYIEDANGNGLVDSGETHWQVTDDLGLKVVITRPRTGSSIP